MPPFFFVLCSPRASWAAVADIYISRDDEAVKYKTTPEQFAERMAYKGITPLELSILWSILRGVEWDVATMDEFPCLLQIEGFAHFCLDTSNSIGKPSEQIQCC